MAPVPSRATREVLVLGGGISGLSLALFLRQALARLPRAAAALETPTRIRVLDAAPKAGGWVQTATRDGFLFEEGPRGFRPSRNGAEMLRLVEQLGLQQEMAAVDPAAHARYILRNGKVEKIPSTIMEALRWPLAGQVLKAGIHEFFTAKGSGADESIYDFTARRFSPVVAERLLDPMSSGIFGGDIRYLSMRACFKMLVDLEQNHGSIVRGMLFGGGSKSDTLLDGTPKSDFIRQHEKSVSVSFRDGMSTLIRAMEQEIKNDALSEFQTNTRVVQVEAKAAPLSSSPSSSSFVVTTEDTGTGRLEQVTASHVISTIPACYLAPAVRSTIPKLAAALDEIKFVDMAMVHVGFHDRAHFTDGFGYLVPTAERERMLGVVFDSNTFPVQNSAAGSSKSEFQTRLTVMAGGAHFPDILSQSEDAIRDIALDALRRHIDITRKPDFARVLTMRNAIPQYHVDFESTVARVEKEAARHAPGLLLGGNSLYGIGLADAVTRSKQVAMDFTASLTGGIGGGLR